jgi:hypothetical protein
MSRSKYSMSFVSLTVVIGYKWKSQCTNKCLNETHQMLEYVLWCHIVYCGWYTSMICPLNVLLLALWPINKLLKKWCNQKYWSSCQMCVPEKFLFAKYSGSINKGCKPILFKKFYFSNFNDLFSNCDFTYCKNLYPLISVVLLFLNTWFAKLSTWLLPPNLILYC